MAYDETIPLDSYSNFVCYRGALRGTLKLNTCFCASDIFVILRLILVLYKSNAEKGTTKQK